MKTLSVDEAAELLHVHRVTLLEKARRGEIPGGKIGRRWVFIDVDLLEYLRSQYPRRALQGDNLEISPCHSTNAKTVAVGGLSSEFRDDAYRRALGLPIAKKPRSTTTS